MHYNKSVNPQRDFVRYFVEPFEKLGVDVSIIELSKSELENLGFVFGEGSTVINCAFADNWCNYHFKDSWYSNSAEQKARRLKSKTLPRSNVYEFYDLINSKKLHKNIERHNKFDSLYQAANQGYQFVYVTDSIGRQMHKKFSRLKEDQVGGVDFRFLIPKEHQND